MEFKGLGEPDGKGLSARNLAHLDGINRVIDDTSFDSIIVIDPNAIIKSVNQTTCYDFGYDSKEELIGQNIKILVGGGMSDKHDGFVGKFFEHGHESKVLGHQRVLQAKRKDGTEFKCIIGIHIIKGTKLIVGYLRNIDSVFHSASKRD